jgi:hypothetical protein
MMSSISPLDVVHSLEAAVEPCQSGPVLSASGARHIRILRAAVVVEAQHIFERRKHAVVHIGRGQLDAAKGWCAEPESSVAGVRLRQQRMLGHAFC